MTCGGCGGSLRLTFMLYVHCVGWRLCHSQAKSLGTPAASFALCILVTAATCGPREAKVALLQAAAMSLKHTLGTH